MTVTVTPHVREVLPSTGSEVWIGPPVPLGDSSAIVSYFPYSTSQVDNETTWNVGVATVDDAGALTVVQEQFARPDNLGHLAGAVHPFRISDTQFILPVFASRGNSPNVWFVPVTFSGGAITVGTAVPWTAPWNVRKIEGVAKADGSGALVIVGGNNVAGTKLLWVAPDGQVSDQSSVLPASWQATAQESGSLQMVPLGNDEAVAFQKDYWADPARLVRLSVGPSPAVLEEGSVADSDSNFRIPRLARWPGGVAITGVTAAWQHVIRPWVGGTFGADILLDTPEDSPPSYTGGREGGGFPVVPVDDTTAVAFTGAYNDGSGFGSWEHAVVITDGVPGTFQPLNDGYPDTPGSGDWTAHQTARALLGKYVIFEGVRRNTSSVYEFTLEVAHIDAPAAYVQPTINARMGGEATRYRRN